jgi:hypothetical protein
MDILAGNIGIVGNQNINQLILKDLIKNGYNKKTT